jgi:hypothetical protein
MAQRIMRRLKGSNGNPDLDRARCCRFGRNGQFISKDNPPAADRRYERSSLNRIELFTNQILVLVSAHSTTDDMHHRERHWTKLVQVFVQIQT